MEPVYTADVLLTEPWSPGLNDFAAVLASRFPEIGVVEPVRPGDPGPPCPAIRIDGATVPLELVLRRHALADEVLAGPLPGQPRRLEPVRAWDPAQVLATHRAYLRIACGGASADPGWMRAYATVATLLAGCLARIGPSAGVVFPASGAVLTAEEAYRAGRMALSGVSPLEAWVTLYPFRAANLPAGAHGAMTRGLAPFLGREVEIAPELHGASEAVTRAQGISWQLLDGGLALAEGQTLPAPAEGTAVRTVDAWLRSGVPVHVLVPAGSPVDPATLALRARPAERLGLAGLGALRALDRVPLAAASLAPHLARAGAGLGAAAAALRPRLAEVGARLGAAGARLGPVAGAALGVGRRGLAGLARRAGGRVARSRGEAGRDAPSA